MQEFFSLLGQTQGIFSKKEIWKGYIGILVAVLTVEHIFIVKAEWVKYTIATSIVRKFAWPFTGIFCASLSAIKE